MTDAHSNPSDHSARNIVEIRGLRNQFGNHVVHDQLDLDVRQGEILSVVGGSGSGKSVLLRTIVGLNRAAAGSVRVFGKDLLTLSDAERRREERRFGVLFQRGALFSSLTVTENVALPLIEHAGLSRQQAERIAATKIALAGLPAPNGVIPAQTVRLPDHCRHSAAPWTRPRWRARPRGATAAGRRRPPPA